MPKGRRHGADRLLGTYAYSKGPTDVGDANELAEDDLWSSAYGSVEYSNSQINPGWTGPVQSDRVHWTGRTGGLSLAFDGGYEPHVGPGVIHQYRNDRRRPTMVASSAPVNVPDWTRFMQVDPNRPVQEMVEPDRVDDDEWVPPHEYLAREHGRREGTGAAMSVFEGVGRTLKGRDMSRVRDAVWNQTGFFG